MIGNTEEEIEEHNELTINEHRNSINRKPKPAYENNKLLNKDRRSKKNKQQLNDSTDQSTIKTDL